MAPSIPAGFPAALVAGTTWKFTAAFSDFPPADGWAVTYQIVGRVSGSAVSTPRVDTSDYLVTVAAADTVAYLPGSYRWTAIASLAGASYVAATGTVDIVANPAVTAGSDQRTHAAIMLEKVEAEIGARFGTNSTPLGSAHESYTIGGRTLTKISLPDLQAYRAALQMEIEKERTGGTLPPYVVTFI